ncbi:Eco57I restriction-modification methylase domain-containing protein [Nitratidesulfovibrio liaohensis]|uniref:site-specific DNA-methyltransferase (adenine-specific) n=1 Tax=Nitratidesulfovibrio liaohensis TaxID=2604158 RepID=A0ABY9R3J3_9BACT|nr:N-6 DNA methylase [Nitratidesulfovibrio liaohensis]WMW65697.1 N-6 DNA methylase [Nitratidesulfovibrio liaohensis]
MRQPESLDSSFSTVRTEGGLLPADILAKILAGDSALPGTSAEAYHLPKGEKLGEAINRSWSRVRVLWERFRQQRETLEQGDTGTSQTRETLLLPLFTELGYGRLFGAKAEDRTVGDKVFSISHFWHHSPVHLIGCKVELDRRAKGVRGAAQSSPHSMVQDFLNRSEAHLWGFCSNGLCLRILRDNKSLSRQAFIEFDLESMFEGEVFSDFALLWMLCHQSRVESDEPASCWLEQWAKSAQDQGVRALDTLRGSVQKTIEILGQGFLESRNPELKERLRSGGLSRQDYFRQLLRLVYRLLFLFAAEDRGLLHAPGTPEQALKRFSAWHSTTRLRHLAGKLSGTKHHDLYEGLKLVMGYLGRSEGCPELGLSPLGSFLWSDEALPDVSRGCLSNGHLLQAVRVLAYTETDGVRRPVDYKNVGARELGSIYESLLELHPNLDIASGAFSLDTASGNDRKTTGSYYTPTQLIDSLLDSALEPVVQQATAQEDAERALLELKICDPSCGSGHFLIAAAHRLAKRLAGVRTGDEEPGPDAVRKALRDVIGRCIYGVDVNPMAVELCKVSLWLEALEPGKPLSFLDHHIRCGNSLIGTTPELIAGGLPDEAFKPIEGDEKAACTALKKANKAAQKKARMPLIAQQEREALARLREAAAALEDIPSDSLKDIHAKESAFRRHESTPEYLNKRILANAWCAAFVIRKYFPEKPGYPGVPADEPFGLTQRELSAFAMGQPLKPELEREVEGLAGQYQFFHWHLAYPEVFARGGFDVMLGNPPWERVKLQEKEWFAERSPEIANAQNAAARKRMIEALKTSDPEFHQAFLNDLRKAEGESHFMRSSGRYPFCGRGDINVYSIFAETLRTLINDKGRMGCVLPSGISTDDTTKLFFQDLVDSHELISLFSFFEIRKHFPGTDSRNPFCLMTVGAGDGTRRLPVLAFELHSVEDSKNPEIFFELHTQEFALLNPNTRTCPVFRSRRDAELTKAIYRRVPVLIREARDGKPEENQWGIKFSTMFHMSNDSHLFKTREQLEADGWVLDGNVFQKEDEKYLPLYEQNLIHMDNHRFASFKSHDGSISQYKSEILGNDRLNNPLELVIPRYWTSINSIESARAAKTNNAHTISFRRSARSGDVRTALFCTLPKYGVGDSIFLMLSPMENSYCLLASLNSYSFDFVVRQSIGGDNASFFIMKQIPSPSPNTYEAICDWGDKRYCLKSWFLPRILELTYTAWDLASFAQDSGFYGSPFRWDEKRRFLLRCEMDAAFFHLYLLSNPDGSWKRPNDETDAELAALTKAFPTPRHAVDYIMDTFPIVRRKDEAAHGEYRTKRVILEIYDELQQAMATGKPYQTRLDPPPADPRCCHPRRPC